MMILEIYGNLGADVQRVEQGYNFSVGVSVGGGKTRWVYCHCNDHTLVDGLRKGCRVRVVGEPNISARKADDHYNVYWHLNVVSVINLS